MGKNIMKEIFNVGQIFLWPNDCGFEMCISGPLVLEGGEFVPVTELHLQEEPHDVYYNMFIVGLGFQEGDVMMCFDGDIKRAIEQCDLIPI